jgi:hypothetical protein
MNRWKIKSPEHLLAIVEQFLEDYPEMTQCRLGAEAVRDRSLVRNLRTGKDITLSRVTKLLRYMEDYSDRH